MNQDPPASVKQSEQPASPSGSTADPANSQDFDPASVSTDEDDEARLPEIVDAGSETVPEGRLAVGRAAIEYAVRHAPTSPGVYRMLNAANDVLYVGKAKNVRKRLTSYARPTGQPVRLARV